VTAAPVAIKDEAKPAPTASSTCSQRGCSSNWYRPAGKDRRLCYAHFLAAGGTAPPGKKRSESIWETAEPSCGLLVGLDEELQRVHRGAPLGSLDECPQELELEARQPAEACPLEVFGGQRLIYLTPPATIESGRMAADFATAFILMRAASPDEAVRQALAAPAFSVSPTEACALLSRAPTVRDLRGIATPDAAALVLEKSGLPSRAQKIAGLESLAPAYLRGLSANCRWLRCPPARAACFFRNPEGPDTRSFLFVRRNGQLKRSGVTHHGKW
jgi:hypothetical protein